MKKLMTIGLLLLCQLAAIAQSNDFNPDLPDHPGQSGWDEQTGALVVTWFTPGQLYDAIREATGNDNINKIRSLTVAGNATDQDMAKLSNLKPYLRLLDLSRTADITDTQNGTFEHDTVLTTLLLPASIERIGGWAFQDSPRLESVTCYATTPPEMVQSSSGKYPFDGCSDALTVYVPAESLPLYAEADGWKDLQLMPITQGAHKLTVNLPANADLQQLKDTKLELANTRTGQSRHYVVTNRSSYTFTNLIQGTQYNIYIRNAREDILATIEAVAIDDRDVQVTFPALKSLRDVTIRLIEAPEAPLSSPEGDTNAQQSNEAPSGAVGGASITWTDLAGNFLAKGETLPAQVEGTKAIAHIKLGETLGTQYQQPADTLIIVGEMDNVGETGEMGIVEIRLAPLSQLPLTGTVTAEATGLPLRGATVSVTQRLNGLYPVTQTATTDAQGHYTLTAYDAPTEITAQATGYTPQPRSLSALAGSSQSEASQGPSAPGETQDFSLAALTGTTVTLNMIYVPAVPADQPLAPSDDMPDLGVINYDIYDVTHQQPLTNITLQGDRLVLQDQQLAEGTQLRITASSATGVFVDIESECTVDANNTAQASLTLVQPGQLRATFAQTDNQAVVAMLYDGDGQLFGTAYYETPAEGLPQTWLSRLPDGSYTLVTMGESQLFNGVQTLDGLTEMRLEEGRDYVKNAVTIQAGRIDSLHNQLIPSFDESVFYYTTDNTHFTANKSSLTVGSYVTLRAQVDFKQGITPTDLRLMFDLPDGCQLVEGSVMAGNQLAQYDVDGQRVTVSLLPPSGGQGGLVRFCIMPTKEGYYTPTATVAFTPLGGTGGAETLQPLGSVAFTAEALGITVPERVSNGRVQVSGTAIAASDVKIYEDDLLIGHTEAGPDGSWSMRCSLNRPYNLSQHYLHAEITTPDGITMQTETQTVTVSHGTVSPVVYASNSGTSSVIKWDFRDFTVTPKHNPWPLGPGILPFTFKVDFYNEDNRMVNDTTLISNVTLYVLLSNDTYVELKAPYNASLHKWVAQADFSIDASPKNVCVDFLQDETILTDRQELDDMLENSKQTVNELQQMVKDVYAVFNEKIVLENQALYDELEQLMAIENPDEATVNRINELLDLLDDDTIPAKEPTRTVEEIEEDIAELEAANQQWLDDMLDILSLVTSTDTIPLNMEEKEEQYDIPLSNGTIHFTSKKESSVNEQALLSEGYTPAPMTDGTSIYHLDTGVREAFLDTRSLMHYIFDWEEGVQASTRSSVHQQNRASMGALVIDSIFDRGERERFAEISDQLSALFWMNAEQTNHHASAQLFLNQGRTLSRDLFNSANKLYKSGLEKIGEMANKARDEILDSLDNRIKKTKQEIEKEREEKKKTELSDYTTRASCENTIGYLKKDIEKYEKEKEETWDLYWKIRNMLRPMPKDLLSTKLNVGLVNNANKLEDTPIGLLYALQICFQAARNTFDELGEWQKTYNAIRAKIPCIGNEDQAIALMTETVDDITSYGHKMIQEEWYRSANFDNSDGWTSRGYQPNRELKLSWFYTSWNNDKKSSNLLKSYFIFTFRKEAFAQSEKERKDLDQRINALECDPDPDPEESQPVETQSGKTGTPDFRIQWSPFFAIDFYHDPSGYVYEAVESNRLEGVRATCYYKEEVEDMYGDLHENVVVWDAEEYTQENPLFTDAEGKYRWDVPQGLWQVKYEKAGYETAYSEWLPVPPPQLEVNVGMTQLRQPAVQRVKACTDGIDITFDKYMAPQTLTVENIFLTKGGQTIGGKIELLNAEDGYASQLRFVYNDNLNVNDKLQLTIKKDVESYAGLQMEQDFTQQFDVEQRITAIVADTVLYMAEGSEQTVTVSILPAEAAKGKTLQVSGADDEIVSHKEGKLTLDANGQAAVTLTATAPGQSAVRFALTDDPDITATTLVIVRDPALMYVYAPKSSRLSGTEVYRGAEIRLTCATAGATILYTLDGSCPCDPQSPAVLTYTAPIAATGDSLVIRSMAVANGMAESDVAEFHYKVIDNPVAIESPTASVGSPAGPAAYYRLDGRRTATPQKGLNIVRREDGSMRKVMIK